MMSKFDISKEQLFKMLIQFYNDGSASFMSKFEDDIEVIVEVVTIFPRSYNGLSLELKRNKEIIEATARTNKETMQPHGVDFYSVIEGEENKPKLFEQIFGNLSYENYILSMLISDEYIAEKTCTLLNTYKAKVIADNDFLDSFVYMNGLKGFLLDFKDDYNFIKRLINIQGEYLLLASDRLKEDRSLMLEAIKKTPWVAFLLNLEHDGPLMVSAVKVIKEQEILGKCYMYLGFLDK